MKQVDRSRFIAHVAGILFERDAQGRCLVGDDLELEEALKDIDHGLEVGLTIKGELFSIMRGYNETLIAKKGA
jgi:hypothetical protein